MRVEIDGRLINSIGVDPERAPLVQQAFELYASGDFSLEQLSEIMGTLGLLSRPSRSGRAKSVGAETLRTMLRDLYYIGSVMYKGQMVPRRHPALISMDLWDRVQAVADFRSRPWQRDLVLKHFHKGMVFCGCCGSTGRVSRMIYTEARGQNGQTYGYFMCMGRQAGTCTLPHLPSGLVEDIVAELYIDLQTGPEFASAIESELAEVMGARQQLVHDMNAKLTK